MQLHKSKSTTHHALLLLLSFRVSQFSLTSQRLPYLPHVLAYLHQCLMTIPFQTDISSQSLLVQILLALAAQFANHYVIIWTQTKCQTWYIQESLSCHNFIVMLKIRFFRVDFKDICLKIISESATFYYLLFLYFIVKNYLCLNQLIKDRIVRSMIEIAKLTGYI